MESDGAGWSRMEPDGVGWSRVRMESGEEDQTIRQVDSAPVLGLINGRLPLLSFDP